MTTSEDKNTYYSVSSGHKLNFSAAHFICHHDWREFLHGHNYKVEFYAEGPEPSAETGFIADFLEVEGPLREIIQEFKGKFILPTLSPFLTFTDEEDGHITIRYKETKRFVFPSEDVYKVPCKFSTCEELAKWLLDRLLAKLGENFLKERNIRLFRLTLYEAKARMAAITKTF